MATKPISKSAYEGTLKTVQSEMSVSDIKKKLEDFSELKPGQFKTIQVGDRIRYFVNSEFRTGGIVKFLKWPEYFVLANYSKNVSWSVQFKEPTLKIWRKSLDKLMKEKDDMKKVYDMYKKGQLVKKK
jgi:hypothetical protein